MVIKLKPWQARIVTEFVRQTVEMREDRECQHNWEIAAYRGKLEHDDRPEFVLLRCAKCSEETMEEFQ